MRHKLPLEVPIPIEKFFNRDTPEGGVRIGLAATKPAVGRPNGEEAQPIALRLVFQEILFVGFNTASSS